MEGRTVSLTYEGIIKLSKSDKTENKKIKSRIDIAHENRHEKLEILLN